jgi:hypothetical protein
MAGIVHVVVFLLMRHVAAVPYDVSEYDPTFASPSTVGPVDNMPVGTGETAANVWVDAGNGSLAILLGRSDSLSGYHEALKVGRIRLVIDPPLMSASRLGTFQQRLLLASGAVSIRTQTTSGSEVSILVWAEMNRSFGIDAIHVEVNSSVPVAITASFDPWRQDGASNSSARLTSARGLCLPAIPGFADTLGAIPDLDAVFMCGASRRSHRRPAAARRTAVATVAARRTAVATVAARRTACAPAAVHRLGRKTGAARRIACRKHATATAVATCSRCSK